jgi:hypothetical protein
MRMFEECSLSSHNEDELVATVGLHFAYLTDQLYGVGPIQISR